MIKIIVTVALALAPAMAVATDNVELNKLNKSDVEAVKIGALEMPRFSADGKIVGGVVAVKGEFLFIVSLQNSWGHFCGGSLIKKNWVLTAAHCIPGGIKNVVIGLHELNQVAGVEKFVPAQVVQHPDYNKLPQDYDFALVRLDSDSKFPPIVLNRKEISGKVNLTTAGWGYTAENGSVSNLLRKVTIPLVAPEACRAAYPDTITDRMLCGGFDAGGKDSCQGDSGGPLFMRSGFARTLVGVVSWGEGCARPKKYGVYSKVASVLAWIDSVTK